MPENKEQVTPVKKDYVCDECGEGNMRPTGVSYLSSPSKYPHKCDNCEHTQIFLLNYPYIDFE